MMLILFYTSFCIGLDGVRNGKTVRKEIAAAHQKKWSSVRLRWWEWLDKQKKGFIERAKNPPLLAKRPARLGPFIMDLLEDMVEKQKEQELVKLQTIVEGVRTENWSRKFIDAHLMEPWDEASKRAAKHVNGKLGDTMQKEMERIKLHVDGLYQTFKDQGTPSKKNNNRTPSRKPGPGPGKHSFSFLPIQKRQDILRERSRQFEEHLLTEEYLVLSPEDVTRLKASYAYTLAPENRFCWNVAARALCEIKAKGLGRTKTVTADFYEIMEPRALPSV